MNVLIVDDSRSNLILMSELVRQVGAKALAFADPVRALADAPHLDVDLFVVDYYMPEMDGLELVSCLRESAWSADIPIVMITGSDQPGVGMPRLGSV
jgi:CheY-like chemotaxis protein